MAVERSISPTFKLTKIMIFDIFGAKKSALPTPETALPGRATKMPLPAKHFVNGNPFQPPYPAQMEQAMFGMGCFWGAERKFWQIPEGIYITAVGYAAGITPNPNYQEVCTGRTGHNEVVLVVYDPQVVTYQQLLKVFWENHNPTQGMRQGNDTGTQYRSGIYCYSDSHKQLAEASKAAYQEALSASGYKEITTEILDAPEFYYAEEYHQQYLSKNPGGYCGLGGTNVCMPENLSVAN